MSTWNVRDGLPILKRKFNEEVVRSDKPNLDTPCEEVHPSNYIEHFLKLDNKTPVFILKFLLKMRFQCVD